MDTVTPNAGDLALPLASAPQPEEGERAISRSIVVPPEAARELWAAAEAEACGLTPDEFSTILDTVGAKHNFGLPSEAYADGGQRMGFLRALRLPDLALAHACALGREAAWSRFLALYRAPLTQAAIAIAGSATLGHDLADSLYSDLYGLRQTEEERRSPLASYSGRGSLLGWLRTVLAQRHVDHYRRTRRETALDDLDVEAPPPAAAPASEEMSYLSRAVTRTLRELPAEDRFVLASYFLDRRTLLEIGRMLQVHEATVSRRVKRLIGDLRKQLLHNLQSGGLSGRAAQEMLGTDPRDLEINLRAALQTSQLPTFSDQTRSPANTESGQL